MEANGRTKRLKFGSNADAEKIESNSFKGLACNFKVVKAYNRARAGILKLPHGDVLTPSFMPVGTYGTIKLVLSERMEKIGFMLILNNTYHLESYIGQARIIKMNGMHSLMNWNRNLLTDSGGFQMVSLCKLMETTEEGVKFIHPTTNEELLLTPEKSVEVQMAIGSDVMMALDDVISVICEDNNRFVEAANRTTRWLERCIKAHTNTNKQNLWGIVQGGTDLNLRKTSLKSLIDLQLPGYAIGGLSGGESKEAFWTTVSYCTMQNENGLPYNKSRYLMGVGYPIDIIVCVALGVDLSDCVYPTRTARFGVALTDNGLCKLKKNLYKYDYRPIDNCCSCYACKNITRAFFHTFLNESASLKAALTEHNLTYMFNFTKRIRNSILDGTFETFTKSILKSYYQDNIPQWIKDALIKGAHFDEF